MSFGEAGGEPLFAADWAETEIDGACDPALAAIQPGSQWAWRGDILRLDAGRNATRGPLRLVGAIGHVELHQMAARRAARFGRRPASRSVWGSASTEALVNGTLSETATLRESFMVTDGRCAWVVAHAPGRSGSGFGVSRVALFVGSVPPQDTALWVISAAPLRERRRETGPTASGFAPGTLIETPFGPIPVERLRPGDPVLTDAGTAPLRRVRVRPSVRALAVVPGILGSDGLAPPLVVGAGTWLGVEAPALPELFSEADGSADALQEALVEARALASLRMVRSLPRADLIAIDVDDGPSGAAIVMAGGVPCLAGPADRAALRCLSQSEAQLALAHPTARLATGPALRIATRSVVQQAT